MRVFFQGHDVIHYTTGLTESLAKLGIDVDLIVYKPLKIPGVNVHFIPALRTKLLRQAMSQFEKKLVVPGLLQKANIIHTNVARTADYALKAKRRMGKPVIHTTHGVPMPEIEIENSQASFAQEEAETLLQFYDNAVPIISISNFCKKCLGSVWV